MHQPGSRQSEQAPPTVTRWAVLLLVALAVLMDGFDVQAMGYVAPAIVKEWGVSRDLLGPVFGAGLFGMLVGSLTLSVVADRVGRRPVLIGATLFFAACMLVTTQVTAVPQLVALRFVTGLGLGAIMPNAMALAGELSPAKRRVTLMMLVSCGFTVGAVVGGFASAALIPAFGWQSVFWVGGAAPLVIAGLMVVALPESGEFASARRARHSVAALFRDGRAAVTLLLWAINFLNLINLYFLSNWLPTIAAGAGMSTPRAVLLGTTLQVGGVIGTFVMGPLIARGGFRAVLVPAFAVAAVSIAAIGRAGIPAPVLFAAVAVTGLCIIGGQPAVNAFAASWYPTALRATGVGWALGVGRIGSIVGPVLGGELIRRQWTNERLFVAVAVPALLSAVLMYGVRDDGAHRGDGPSTRSS